MELFFNEFSLRNEDDINRDSITAIVSVYKELLKYNVTTCRMAHDDYNQLLQMIRNIPNSINIKNFYFSFFRSPYESEPVEEIQDDYLEHSWIYNNETCIGFALAFLCDSASFSIYNTEWNTAYVEFFRDNDLNYARNICVKEHVNLHISQMQNEIELIECDIQITDKKITLRHDHGMDELKDFSKRLLRCPYLIEVVNSLPYNPHERKFIRKVRENGLIEIVLPWTDEGFGIVVRTTGRTIRETKKIAEIINEEFGYIQ